MTKMKIFIIGSFHGNNIGDMAIVETFVNNLPSESKIRIATLNPKKLSRKIYIKNKNAKFTNLKNPFQLLQSFLWAKKIVIGGGGLFFDYSTYDTLKIFGKSQLLFWCLATVFSKIIGKEVYWIGVGISDIKSTLGKFIFEYTSKLPNKITVRDEKSKQILKTATQTADIVYMGKIKKIQNKKSKKIALVLFYKIKKEDIKELKKYIQHLKNESFTFEIISTNPKSDTLFLNSMSKTLGVNYMNITNFTTTQFRTLLKTYTLIISMRMHAILLGYQEGVPGIGIKIEKVKLLQKELYNSKDTPYLTNIKYNLLLNKTRLILKTKEKLLKKSYKNYMKKQKASKLNVKIIK